MYKKEMDSTAVPSGLEPLRGGTRFALAWLNGPKHRIALSIFMTIIAAHWAEHLLQAAQVFVLGWPRPEARGAVGQVWPWLVRSEWLHYGYAVAMLAGLLILRGGFHGRARSWWNAALALQIWHFVEHALLLGQALTGHPLFGRAEATSVVQLITPRVELHLFYNAVVFTPMVIALWVQYGPARPDQERLAGST
jgi:hypothetical protein